MNTREEMLKYASQKIVDRYGINTEIASKYAIEALNALESHGGSIFDLKAVNSVIEVVVKKWLEK